MSSEQSRRKIISESIREMRYWAKVGLTAPAYLCAQMPASPRSVLRDALLLFGRKLPNDVSRPRARCCEIVWAITLGGAYFRDAFA